MSGFWRKGSLFAHEIGHALGREIHDDTVCIMKIKEYCVNNLILDLQRSRPRADHELSNW